MTILQILYRFFVKFQNKKLTAVSEGFEKSPRSKAKFWLP